MAAFCFFTPLILLLPKTRAGFPIRHATDVTTGAEREDQTVRIQGTRTASIATSRKPSAAFPDWKNGTEIVNFW